MRFRKDMAIAFLVGFFATFFLWPPANFSEFLLKADIGLVFTIFWGFIGGAMP